MRKEEFYIKNHLHKVNIWDDVKDKKGVVQIVHGMSEYIDRYDDFAKFLNTKGFICIGMDHLGHGTNTDFTKKYVSFDKKKGYKKVQEIQIDLFQKIKFRYDLPLYIFGHSMGSFITRCILPEISMHLNGYIICGTSYNSPIITGPGLVLTNLFKLVHKDDYYSSFIDSLMGGSLTKKMKKSREIKDDIEWVTTDKERYELLKKDPYLSRRFSVSGNRDLCYFVFKCNKKSTIKKVNPNIQGLFISGEKDPLNYGKVEKVADKFSKYSNSIITYKEYLGMRHELINEVDNNKVYNDVASFLERCGDE